jgi:predicted aspartyl protease
MRVLFVVVALLLPGAVVAQGTPTGDFATAKPSSTPIVYGNADQAPGAAGAAGQSAPSAPSGSAGTDISVLPEHPTHDQIDAFTASNGGPRKGGSDPPIDRIQEQAQAAFPWASQGAQRSAYIARALEQTRAQDLRGVGPFDPSMSIPLQADGGTYAMPALINDTITLNFTVDSGAADVIIPADVVLTLIRAGTLDNSDFIGSADYVLADGSIMPSKKFRIRSLKVGDLTVENVSGSIAPARGSLLLGQSFLSRFKSWSIDNVRQVLVLIEK